MKKVFLPLVFILIFSLSTSAQNKKGEWTLSLTASPYPTTTNGENDFGAIGLLSLEYLVSDKVSVAMSLFNSNNTVINDNSGVAIRGYGIVPSVQYYFINKAKYNICGQLGYGLGFSSDDRTVVDLSLIHI